MPLDIYTPQLIGNNSQGSLSQDTTTYNQAGVSYNQAGVIYGGFYGYSDVIPLISLAPRSSSPSLVTIANSPRPSITVSKTLMQLSNPGISYNESGVSYNDSRYAYGGVYGYTDEKTIISSARTISPLISGFMDNYEQGGAFHRILMEDRTFITMEDGTYTTMEG